MASLEKLVKAFEALKVFQPGTGMDDSSKKKEQAVSKKEKITNSNTIADSICSSNLRNVADFPKFLGIAMETFLMLCDDQESDVRMVADECLNRTIKTLLETNLGRLQVELYKEIKKNGRTRSLRAALWRFADMCHLIRPQKCRPYVVNLLPCIARICRRPEESIQETLATAMVKVCPVLMGFTNDQEIKVLLKSFLPNVRSNSATCRRTAAKSLTLICQYSRKPTVFFSWLLSILLDMTIPIDAERNVYVLLGVFQTLRHMIPHLANQDTHDESLKGSFGVMTREQEVKVSSEQTVQGFQSKCWSLEVYELLLHYTSHEDHNVITASLETLQQLLRNTPQQLLYLLTTRGSIKHTNIYEEDMQQQLRPRSGSQSGRLPSVGDEVGLEDEMDQGSEVSSQDTSGLTSGDSQTMLADLDPTDSDLSGPLDSPPEILLNEEGEELLDEGPDPEDVFEADEVSYTNVEIGNIDGDRTMSQSSSADTLSDIKGGSPRRKLRAGVSEDQLNITDEVVEIDVSEAIQAPPGGSTQAATTREGDIGKITDDDDVPAIHCVRLLCSKFLLTGYRQGLIADRQVRVSAKALALGCVGSAMAIYPQAFLCKLHKSSPQPGELQDVRDVLQYTSHSDPQLKGNAAVLIGNTIHAALIQSRGRFDTWVKSNANQDMLTVDELVNQLIAILEDDSSVATRLGIIALRNCLTTLLNSAHSELGLKILLAMLHLRDNPYWLVKVELLELISDIDYKLIKYLETLCTDLAKGSHHFVGRLDLQHHMLEGVMLNLLGDDDGRVRNAAANALTRVTPKLFYAVDNLQHDPVIARAREDCDHYLKPILHEWSQPPQSSIHGLVNIFNQALLNANNNGSTSLVEASLSRVVASLLALLNKSNSRYLTYGCCQALCSLSECYLPTMYPVAWCCLPAGSGPPGAPKDSGPRTPNRRISGRSFNVASSPSVNTGSSGALSLEDLSLGSGGGALPVVLSVVTSSAVAMDLSSHQHALHLAGNIFCGMAYKCLRPGEETTELNAGTDESRWVALTDRTLVAHADTLLAHLARLLNMCAHIIEEQPPGPPQSKTSLPSLPNAPSLSPIKRKAKGIKDDSSDKAQDKQTLTTADSKTPTKTPSKGDKEKDTEKDKGKKDGLGTFYNLPHYMKLYDVLRAAYSNYKLCLDLGSTDKFGMLLRACLEVLSEVLEIAGVTEIGKSAEELLGYLKSTITLESSTSILCVQQLLKSLFGTNLASQWESEQITTMPRKPGKATRLAASIRPGLYHCCFTTPYTQFTQRLTNAAFKASSSHGSDTENSNSSLIGWLKKRAERKIPAVLKPGSKADKSSIASYIRLFEPLVIKALKQYTITSSLDLQRQVLNLLAQLVQLRVNYCLLDSDQIFIGFVIKQFEFIEEGQIRNSETLIPNIFNFLVLLSYERYHSKIIIGMPKIIQLCDGIMASGQQPTTHAIPALQPIIHDLFVLRSANKADAGKDLDTQREVVVAMLLRLIQYYQVLEMFIVVLHQCHKESEDKWKRLSRQVTDMVLPLLVKQQVNLDQQVALDVVHRLFESVAPSVFRPVDVLLKALFSPPYDLSSVRGLQRWVCLVLSILRVLISQSKEEVVLSRLQELNLGVHLFMDTLLRHRGVLPREMEEQNYEPPHRTPPEEVFGRLLLQLVGLIGTEIHGQVVRLPCQQEYYNFLCQQLAHLLLYITHMFQSGLFRRVATATMRLVCQDTPSYYFSIPDIDHMFKEIGTCQPTLTLQWCNILILLNYDDQNWWSKILQTQRKYMLSSPNRPEYDAAEALLPPKRCCNMEIVRRGGLILFCDYVCENLSDAEHMTWVIINHVGDLIELYNEPPVQDFISAIHRNSAASGLFIQAIHSRCENMSKASQVKKVLHCLEAIHLSQSGALLTLLIDKFLNTNHLAVSRFCDMIACRRVEMLLAESVEESSSQLPLEDLEKLLQFMKSAGLTKRHARLAPLLNKLRNLLCPESRLTLSPEKTHPLAITQTRVTDIKINKDWYSSIVRDQCFSPTAQPRECAQLLAQLDYSNILNIIMTKEFNMAILEECVALGTQRSQVRIRQLEERDISVITDKIGNSPARTHAVDPLLQAAQMMLFRHLNNIINMLPVPHQVINYEESMSQTEEQYREKMEDIFHDSSNFETVFHLVRALVHYLISLPMFPWQPTVPEESVKDVARFSLLTLEMIHWMFVHDQFPSTDHLQVALECFSIVQQNPKLEAVIGQKEQTTWVCSAIRTIHQILSSMLVLPSDRLVTLPNHDGQEELPNSSPDDFHHAIGACDQMSELVHCLKTHLSKNHMEPVIPQFLVRPMRNIIIGLARLPLVNSYARTPPLVWKLGWMPSPSGEMKTKLPPLPLEYLQEKDVLREFIYRVNLLGWTSRQQFEETWMCLLGVLNPVSPSEEQQVSVEEDIERTQCAVLAVRCITSLLVQSMLTPHSGNPSNSLIEHRPRDKPLAFLHTRCGRKLVHIRGVVEREIWAIARKRSDLESHHQYASRGHDVDRLKYLFDNNLERELGDHVHNLGQLSVESIWGLIGMLEPGALLQDSGSDTTTGTDSTMDSSPRQIYPPVHQVTLPADTRERSSSLGGLDIHSCLQFLLDLYGQFLSPAANPKVPLMQLNETIKSVVALSDILTEKQQYEWMLDVLLEVHKTHPAEDEQVMQYLVVGICKAAAVIGMVKDVATAERIVKLVEQCLKSTHLSTKVATLYGSLYILETGMSELTHQIIPLVTEYLLRQLSNITHVTITSQQHVLVIWTTSFYIIENYQEEIRDTDFMTKIVQLAVSTASGPEEMTPLSVYLAILRGLERLLLADVLTQQDSETLVKLSVERLCLPNPQRALASLGLMLTCMYSGKQGDAWTPTQTEFPQLPPSSQLQDPESLIVAMERVTVLFDRIRKGFPYEARVITRVLPTFLADFFPPQDIMNKVIGEFLSSQQPHPQLMAKVVFQVFENLLQKDQQALVKDWVMLSLSNFTQRTPVAMAIWSLTCFFISASTNTWLRALLPHVIGRMGKMESVDRKLFCIAALDFRHQLTDDSQRRAFQSTFQAVAQPDTPYADLIACCNN